nr:response regulator [Odoribacter splanchnicus]
MDCKPKLLYAEDNRLTAKEMTEILEEEGYEVVTTYSGDEAWETFERISPDLVLCWTSGCPDSTAWKYSSVSGRWMRKFRCSS